MHSFVNWDSEKLLYIFEIKICGESAFDGEVKTKFWYRLNSYKSKQKEIRKK